MRTSPESSDAFAFGKSVAPLYLGFCAFVHHQSKRAGLDEIHFLTREGEFLQTVYDAIFDQEKNGDGVQSVLLETSRLVTFGPSLQRLDASALKRLWTQYPRQSPAALLKTLGIAEGSVRLYFDTVGIDMARVIENPWADEDLLGVLGNEDFLEVANQLLQRNRQLAQRFFDPHFKDSRAAGIADVGWRGSVQDNLCRLYPETQFHGFYLGLSRYFNPQADNSTKTAFGPDRNRSSQDFDLLHGVDVIEMLSNSPNGSVVGYEERGDEVQAVRQSDPREDAAWHAFTGDFQRGVLAAAQDSNSHELLEQLVSGELRSKALNCWRKILKKPSPGLVNAYFSLQHNEEFGLGKYLDKSRTPLFRDLLLSPFSAQRRAKIIDSVRYSQWANGHLRRSDLPLHRRWLMYLMIKAGLAVKSWKHSRAFERRRV